MPGCGRDAPARLVPPDEIVELDVDGHSLAYGTGADRSGRGGTGAASQVAEALDLKENNNSIPGSRIQAAGHRLDGWGNVLDTYPRDDHLTAGAPLPRMALLWYGAGDLAWIGPDLSVAEQTLRTAVSRHRASAVYEAGTHSDPSISADDRWDALEVSPGWGSGGSVLEAGDGPATITIDLEDLAEGATVALGFVQEEDTSARYTIEVDGEREGILDTSGPLAPKASAAGYVFRVEDLPAGEHTIEISADEIDGAAYFDYWQIEPPEPEPVVLMEQYLLPNSESFDRFPHRPTDQDFIALNQMIESLAQEFGPRVIAVDTDSVIGKSRDLIAGDLIHLNQRGYDAVATATLKEIARSAFADELDLPKRAARSPRERSESDR